ncbi:TRAP transporter large permease subunit [Leyella stercorea]|uniref:TRAP transporter large permease subunit n=1 Tax=Leyella stercorea TaxID=363265 RepID=UPI003AB28618
MVRWARSLVGSQPGGLGTVAVLACALFAALTGSAPATVAAIGSIMIPSMVENGYEKRRKERCAAHGRRDIKGFSQRRRAYCEGILLRILPRGILHIRPLLRLAVQAGHGLLLARP